jgi:hypothetical protein
MSPVRLLKPCRTYYSPIIHLPRRNRLNKHPSSTDLAVPQPIETRHGSPARIASAKGVKAFVKDDFSNLL